MEETQLERSARALGDRTRHRLFRHISESEHPVGIQEMTALVGTNHNAVRQHLAVLKDAGLVVEATEARGRPGRPRLVYELALDARGTWETDGPYAYLSALLAEVASGQRRPRDVGRMAGRAVAAVNEEHSSLKILGRDLERRGFRPHLKPGLHQQTFVLQRCPFADVAMTHPEIVCELHRGLAEGVADGLDDLVVKDLVRKDPRSAGCRLIVQSVS